MISVRRLIRYTLEPTAYIWVDAVFVQETPKAVLIVFDGRKAWVPKVWIVRIKRSEDIAIKIKISDYHWAKKVA